MTKIDLIQKMGIQPDLNKLAGKTKDDEKVPAFSDTLKNMMEQVDVKHKEAGKAVEDFIAGKDIELHEVMAMREEAQISFQFLMEIRNRMIEAYQEVSRMQV